MDCDNYVALNKSNLGDFHVALQTAVNLFIVLERGGDPSREVLGGEFIQYRIVAARDACLNLYHFERSLDAIVKLAPQSQRYSISIYC